jgi:hypothetical protein
MTNARRRMCSLLSVSLLPLMGLLLSVAAWGQSGTISTTNFGMQCGTGVPSNCPMNVLPTTQIGLFRLWDSGTYWAVLQPDGVSPSCKDPQLSTYCWDNLDSWLDAIAASTTIKDVVYTFGGVPCQLVNEGNGLGADCNTHPPTGPNDDPNGLAYPPNDLISTGSPSFSSFVTNLTKHCSLNGNCVGNTCAPGCKKTNLIQYYEMWNEPNGQFWNPGGTEAELENMVFPVRSTIRTNVTGAVILTPGFVFANTDYSMWFEDWLSAENTNGTLSDDVAFHVYFPSVTPETQYSCYILATTSSAASTCSNATNPSFLYMKDHVTENTAIWAAKPWINTETNFSSAFVCPTEDTDTAQATTAADCAGQVVRWQLLQDSSGATSVAWYFWNTTIGNPPTIGEEYYDNGLDADTPTAYSSMIKYLGGGKFTQLCANTSGTSIWTCKFTDANGNGDLFVWTTNTTAQSYTPPAGAVNYWILAGPGAGTCAAIPGTGFTVTVDPYLLVKSACSVIP